MSATVPAAAVEEFLSAVRATLNAEPGTDLLVAATNVQAAIGSMLSAEVDEIRLAALAAYLRERAPAAAGAGS